jgi:uncharacterized membrane protein
VQNSLLLTSILDVYYVQTLGIDLRWVLKLIHPFIFALTPAVTYNVYQRIKFPAINFTPKDAALSVLVFIFFYGFFKDMTGKQHIAEFLVALLLLTFSERKDQNTRILMLLFIFGATVTHYATTGILIGALGIGFICILVFERRFDIDIFKLGSLLFVITISWYMFTSSGELLKPIATSVFQLVTSIFRIFGESYRTGATYATSRGGAVWTVYKLLQAIIQGLIFFGVLSTLFDKLYWRHRSNLWNLYNKRYLYISIGFYFYVLIQIFASFGLGLDRILQISLLILSPFAIIGYKRLFGLIFVQIDRQLTNNFVYKYSVTPTQILAVILAIFVLFNSGVAFVVLGEESPAYSITLDDDNWEDWGVFYNSEVEGAQWLNQHGVCEKVSVFEYGLDQQVLSRYFHYPSEFSFFKYSDDHIDDCTFTGSRITQQERILRWTDSGKEEIELQGTPIELAMIRGQRVYSSGRSAILHSAS